MKKICIMSFIILSLSVIIFLKDNNDKVLENNYQTKTNLISMMVEQGDGTYKEEKSQKFVTDDYILNPYKSGCEGLGKLTWNESKSKVEADLLTSDKCYAYFDIFTLEKYCDYTKEDSLVCDIVEKKDNTLIYHDGKCDYEGEENCELEAGDLSYRFSGVSNIVNNFVCLDEKNDGSCSNDDLYRIIGFFKNEEGLYETKMIKYIYGTIVHLGDEKAIIEDEDIPSAYVSTTNMRYYWNSSKGIESNENNNMWQESNLNRVNLNKYYYNYITTKLPFLKNNIVEHTWITGGIVSTGNAKITYNNELGNNKVKINDAVCYIPGNTSTKKNCTQEDIEYKAKIGLMYLSDFLYGTLSNNWIYNAASYATGVETNWLSIGMVEWTISRSASSGDSVMVVGYNGSANNVLSVFDTYVGRPSFYLSTSVKLKSGFGTKDNPYRLYA